MTIQEMAQIIDILSIEYPQISQKTDEEKTAMVNLWAGMFADDQWKMVAMAVKAFMASDEKGFPPHMGQIKAIINKMTIPPELKMNELEAWTLVRNAIHGASIQDWSRKRQEDGTMGPPSAVVQFNQLPKILQKLVGDPKQLALWEALPDDEINTIIQSNFMRSWRSKVSHEKEMLSLPSDVREGMQMIAAQNRALLEEGKN